jgi:hypothetical protein
MTANPCEICKSVCTSDCPFFNETKEAKPTGKTYILRYGRVASLAPYESCRVELEEEFDISIPKQVAFESLASRVEELVATRRKVKLPIGVVR